MKKGLNYITATFINYFMGRVLLFPLDVLVIVERNIQKLGVFLLYKKICKLLLLMNHFTLKRFYLVNSTVPNILKIKKSTFRLIVFLSLISYKLN